MTTADDSGGSYQSAGVDIAAGERAVDLMRARRPYRRPEVIGGVGGFAGLFDAARLTTLRRPLLATSTDGVGTKVMLASGSACTTPSASTWSAWSSMTWWCAAPSRCS